MGETGGGPGGSWMRPSTYRTHVIAFRTPKHAIHGMRLLKGPGPNAGKRAEVHALHTRPEHEGEQ